MPATFRAIAFVATELDARPGRTLRRAHRTMSEAELAEIVRVLRSVPESVAAWSDGTAGFDAFEIRVIDEPVRHLSATGPDRFWVGPRDIASVIDRHVGRGKWDNVFLVHPTDGSYPQCGWGCSIGPSAAANGAGFSSIVSDRWQADHVRLFPEEGFVHEWLHQVEGTYRNHGLPLHELPDLHDVDGRTSARPVTEAPFGRGYVDYERQTGTWQPWYRDLLTGTVGPKGAERVPVGMTPERWARRPPTR